MLIYTGEWSTFTFLFPYENVRAQSWQGRTLDFGLGLMCEVIWAGDGEKILTGDRDSPAACISLRKRVAENAVIPSLALPRVKDANISRKLSDFKAGINTQRLFLFSFSSNIAVIWWKKNTQNLSRASRQVSPLTILTEH